ncbi:MAG: ATP-binding protein [Candidatus Kapaibacterium sp.]
MKLSLKNKLILIILLVVFFATTSVSLILIVSEMNFMEDDLIHEAGLISALLSDYSKDALQTDNHSFAESLLDELETTHLIDEGYLYDSTGALFATFPQYLRMDPSQKSPCIFRDTVVRRDDAYYHIRMIHRDDRMIGSLCLKLNTKYITARTDEFLWTAALVLGGFLVFSYFLALLLQNIISRPIRRLSGILEKVGHSQDYSRKVSHSSNDEIGQLYDSFNNMIEAIQRHDRQRASIENYLRESEARFRELFENIYNAVIVLEPDPTYKYIVRGINQACEQEENIRRDEAVGKAFEGVFPNIAGEQLIGMMLQAEQTGNPARKTILIDRKKDTWYNCFVNRLPDGNLLLVYEDVSEKVASEQRLRTSEDWQKRILESISEGFFVLNKNFQITYFNRKAEELLQRKREEVLGKHLFEEAFPEAKGSIFEDKYGYAIENRKSLSFETYFGVAPIDNWYEVWVYPFEDGITVFFQVTTERKRAEEALRFSELRYRVLFETMNQGVVLQDAKGNVISANKAAEKILGISAAGDFGFAESEFKYFHEDGTPMAEEETPPYKSLISGRRNENPLMGFFNPQAREIRWLHVSSVPQFKSGEDKPHSVFTTYTNLTERKRNSEERERLNRQLTAKNRELEQIVYVTSHDLRSPLVNILGFSSELSDACESLSKILNDPERNESDKQVVQDILQYRIPTSLGYINKSGQKIDSLLKGLLYLSRLGRNVVSPGMIDMDELIDKVLADFTFRLKEEDAVIQAESLPGCYADPGQINQVFANLIDNALKYSKKKQKIHIKISGWHENGMSVYCVEDNGVGIEKSHMPKIFELFHRLDPEKSEGEGLGLNIVAKIIERNSGSIRVESEPGRGTKFYILLPSSK